MLIFLYGEDTYRSKKKLDEIVEGYKKVHRSGLNLIYVDASCADFKDFFSNFRTTSMFAEKKLIILRNLFSASGWMEVFLKNIENIKNFKDIVLVYENCAVDQKTKFFKILQKCDRCQEFKCFSLSQLKKWVQNKMRINSDALELLVSYVGNNLWQMSNEVNKLSNYKKAGIVAKEDVELLVKPNNIENDIFKTIDALAAKNKKQALFLFRKHLDSGDNALYLLSMAAYQFRNLLVIKELMEKRTAYNLIAKKSGLHPFVVQKIYNLCSKFSFEELKKIYRKIFQIDSDIKTGRIEPELALELLVSCI